MQPILDAIEYVKDPYSLVAFALAMGVVVAVFVGQSQRNPGMRWAVIGLAGAAMVGAVALAWTDGAGENGISVQHHNAICSTTVIGDGNRVDTDC